MGSINIGGFTKPGIAFLDFLKFDRDYRARGVVMATFIAAIAAYVLYFN